MTAANRHECQRCGSDDWEYVDYGGCSVCRPYEDRAAANDFLCTPENPCRGCCERGVDPAHLDTQVILAVLDAA